MEILKSILSLTKSNNGFWKSEKQKDFLIKMLYESDNLIGFAESGFNSCPIFAYYDDKGITRILKHTKNGNVITFERKIDNILTVPEIKEIKRLERLYNKNDKEIKAKEKSFEDGSYNGTNDVSTYDKDMIEMHFRIMKEKKEFLNKIQEKINIIKN